MKTENTIKPIFTRNDVIDKMAFLNWRMGFGEIQNLISLAEGYFQSAILLTENCLQDNRDKKADIIIFPILTCLNHGIELYLKANTMILNKMLNNGIENSGTHNLSQLFETFKSRVKDLDGQKVANEFEKEFQDLSQYIDELVIKIKAAPKNDKMDFSRYPFGKKDGKHFYVDAFSNIEVDLENLLQRTNNLFEKLDSFTENLYYERFEQKE